MDERPRPKRAPSLHCAASCFRHVHAAAGGAHLRSGAAEPAPAHTHTHGKRREHDSDTTGPRVWECVCVPPMLPRGAVRRGGGSGLGRGGAQALLSGLHAMDLQFLHSDDRRKRVSLRSEQVGLAVKE